MEDDSASGDDDDETMEQLQIEEEEEVVSTSVEENEIASDDENEFLGDLSNTNRESIILYRWRFKYSLFYRVPRKVQPIKKLQLLKIEKWSD